MELSQFSIPRPIYSQILLFCAGRLPEEAVGLLTGSTEGSIVRVSSFIPLSNKANEPHAQFSVDPSEWTRALFGIEKNGHSIVGLLHSHPVSPPVPSSADLTTEWHAIPSHWVVSFENKRNPAVEAYRFRADGSYERIRWIIAD